MSAPIRKIAFVKADAGVPVRWKSPWWEGPPVRLGTFWRSFSTVLVHNTPPKTYADSSKQYIVDLNIRVREPIHPIWPLLP